MTIDRYRLIQPALDYLENRYGITPGDVHHLAVEQPVAGPARITLTLVARDLAVQPTPDPDATQVGMEFDVRPRPAENTVTVPFLRVPPYTDVPRSPSCPVHYVPLVESASKIGADGQPELVCPWVH